MITIYKYAFPLCNPNSVALVELPKDAEIIRLDVENGHPFLWAIVNTNKPKVTRKFYLHKTGSNMDETAAKTPHSSECALKHTYLGRFGIWAEMELMMYVFDGGEVGENHKK